jgi:predicted DNA binding CopG/RHH family protein
LHDFKETDKIFILSPRLAHRIRERAKKRMISIRLAHWEIEKSKEIAKKRGVPYQSLLRQWIDEGLRTAFQDKATRKAA